MHRAHNVGANRIGGSGSGNAEIRDLHLSLRGNHNVLRFNVTMYNILVVGCLNAPSDLNRNADRLLVGELPLFLNIGL